jgi:hypothetical protein
MVKGTFSNRTEPNRIASTIEREDFSSGLSITEKGEEYIWKSDKIYFTKL